MLRGWVKSGAAQALWWSKIDRWIGALAGCKNMPLILGYHRVAERYPFAEPDGIPAMCISGSMLERHLDWVGRRYRFVSLDELGIILEDGAIPAKPVAAVTFDDGYRDFYDNAFPLLFRKGIPAAVFVVTDLIGTRRMQVHDRLYHVLATCLSLYCGKALNLIQTLDRLAIRQPATHGKLKHHCHSPFALMRALLETLPQAEILRLVEALEVECDLSESAMNGPEPLNWEMVAEIQRAGMTIASHTRTHAFLTNESPERVLKEVAGSRDELGRRLGITVRHFAYPDGRFDDIAVSAVAEAGYSFAYTTCLHRNPAHPFLTIPRKGLWENSCLDAHGCFSSAIMSCQVNRTFDFIGSACDVNHDRAAGKNPNSSGPSHGMTVQ